MRSMGEWAWSGQGRALAADVWRGAALGAASVLGTARALHACDAVLQAGARRGGGAALAANLFSSLLIGVIGERLIITHFVNVVYKSHLLSNKEVFQKFMERKIRLKSIRQKSFLPMSYYFELLHFYCK
jgi:hypothetical protein